MATSFYSPEELQQIGFRRVGTHVLISRKASIYAPEKMEIGDHVRIDDFCILSGRIILGSYIHISAMTMLFGGDSGIVLSDYVTVSSRIAIYAVTDDYSGEGMANPMLPEKYRKVTDEKVLLEKHVLVGSGCTILPGVTLGEGASVGSMSLINRSLEPWGMYVGIPCKRIKDRSRHILELEEEFRKEVYGG